MQGIDPFQSGRPLLSEITADKLNRVLAEIKRNRPVVAAPLSARVTGDGTFISLNTSQGSGTTTASHNHPFQIRSTKKPSEDEEESNEYIVTVSPGTINSLLPDEIFDAESIKQHTIPKDALRHVVLNAQSDGQQITTATISLEPTAPEPQSPVIFGLPAQADFLIGVVYNSSVYQVITDNISVTGKQQFVTEKTAPAQPGELPYEVYYVWG